MNVFVKLTICYLHFWNIQNIPKIFVRVFRFLIRILILTIRYIDAMKMRFLKCVREFKCVRESTHHSYKFMFFYYVLTPEILNDI